MVGFRGMKIDIPPGTLYMLVLKTLARLGPMHGYGIALYIQQTTGEVLHVEEGTLIFIGAPPLPVGIICRLRIEASG